MQSWAKMLWDTFRRDAEAAYLAACAEGMDDPVVLIVDVGERPPTDGLAIAS